MIFWYIDLTASPAPTNVMEVSFEPSRASDVWDFDIEQIIKAVREAKVN